MADRNPAQPPPLPKQPQLPVILVAGRGKRALSAVLDLTVILLLTMFLVTKIFWPKLYPEAGPSYVSWMKENQVIAEKWQENGQTFLPQYTNPPLAVQEGRAFGQALCGMIVWVYFFFSEVFMRGGSLGKSVFGFRVISLRHGGPPMPLEAGVRASIKASCFLFPPLVLVNFFVMMFHRQRQALHDMPAATLVVAAPAVLMVPKSRMNAD
ncbi:RDD family protein [Cerasicoccus maritimus]|uniref:RDD family protein n=1 Tax=Cerasicoccus maritimus TaxID=490089 RepID=UPI0028525766|nr:RDD family protein [Cerasicoccus maritimus]